MSVRLGLHSRAHAIAGRLAVASVAALATVVGAAPVAVADDDVAPVDTDTSEVVDPAPTDPAPADPAPQPTDPAPTAETPDAPEPVDEAPAEAPAATQQSAKKAASADVTAAAIVPDFGYNKFRVGVKIADGSTVPPGTTTLGSTIRIYETGPGIDNEEMTLTTTCVTTIDEGAAGTFCDNLNPFGEAGWDEALYIARFGDTVTVTQTTVNAGLTIVDGVKTVIPTCNEDETNCGEGDNRGDVVLADAPLPVVDEPDPEPEPDPETPSEEAVLPDTGGSDAQLFALGIALIGSGGWLIGQGRRPRRRSDAVV